MIPFLEINLKDAIDILLVAGLVYLLIVLFKRTGSLLILGGMALLGGIYLLASIFGLYLTTLIFKYVFGFLIVIFAVVFQRELRNFFEWIFILGIFKRRKMIKPVGSVTAQEIREAVTAFSDRKRGALIVIQGTQPLERLIQGGFELGGVVSNTILQSIFDPSSPGHDGAVIVEGDRITKFGVHLPLAEKVGDYTNLGTRHRSARGLSERSDALVVVVSEERGSVSIARDGILREITVNELESELQGYVTSQEERAGPWYRSPTKNLPEKIVALLVSAVLWIYFK